MTAEKMFKELGFYLILNTVNCLTYKKENDHDDISINFYKNTRTYYVSYMHWIDELSKDWITMSERKENLKHCSKYGHWQKTEYYFSVEEHKAIHKQCRELGWLDD